MKLAELFIECGFNMDNAKMQAFNSTVTAASTKFLAMVEFIKIATSSFKSFTTEIMQGVAALVSFQAQTGLLANKLMNLQIAGNMNVLGLSNEQIKSSIQGLQESLVNIRMGVGDVAPFSLLQIDVFGKDAFQVLDEIRERIKGLDDATATNLIKRAGLDPNFIQLLRLSNSELATFNKQFMLTPKELESIKNAGLSINQITTRLNLLKDKVIAKIAGLLEDKLKKVIVWLDKNGTAFVDKIANLLKILIEFLSTIFEYINRITEYFNGKSNKALFALLLGVTALMILLNPIKAGIIGLLLLLDDLTVWAEGGKSVFGLLLKFILDGIDQIINRITKAIAAALGIKGLPGSFSQANASSLGKLTAAVSNLSPSNKQITNAGSLLLPFTPFGVLAPIVPLVNAMSSLANQGGGNGGGNGGSGGSTTQANTFNIHSNASDGKEVARHIQPLLNYSLSELNNGAF